MIESNKIYEILQGSNIYSNFYINGWCKTSSGVSFGKERIKELLDYIELEKNDIGLKDINEKSIYADCSIVEFKNIGSNYTGYFTFDLVKLCYKIIVLDIKSVRKKFIFNSNNIENIKIIDTIQQNKLGLIK